ncbi:MCE family protein [Nocardia yunnanensis]|uniref:MCE family protein n=1 Tax=Nocardia yunnanensis TaxID=2382165 RepID=A0A386ZB72_9NOCA|nr:MlaD family protein [Nocardia yunnanensis]AYF74828.1 MCE family protein [Nocardia yunnanensis]
MTTTARGRCAALALGLAVSVSGCALDPAEAPMPGAGVSGPTYSITIEFANALNLPTQAKVVANGAKIGSLRSVRVVDPSPAGPGRVEAVVSISESVRLPATTTAQLRQNTILGDIFIGLTTPTTGFDHTIAPGGTIPLSRTKAPLQVEDLLAGLSQFIGGGALHQVQQIIDQSNAVLPEQTADTARIFDTLGRDIEDVSGNLDTVDRFLDAVQADLASVLDNPRQLGELLSPRGSVEIPADANSLIQTLGVVGNLSIIAQAIRWLGPLLTAGDAAAKAFVPMLFGTDPLDLSAPSNLNRFVALVRDKVIPFVEQGPKVNITGVSIEGAPLAGDPQVDAIARALRMIGVVR